MARCKRGHFVIPVNDLIVVHNSYLQNTAANSQTFVTISFDYFVIFL